MWKSLNSQDQFIDLLSQSKEEATLPFVVFKHSTKCSISSMALNRLETKMSLLEKEQFDLYKLDLIQHRDVSNSIATELGVEHQSPQVLVIKSGVCVYNESHMGIDVETLIENIR
ncbi:MAG: bacillithiol system protein YtxJ [Flavobacteriales bacterium]|jgi:bacillithiol system protein YtxJ